MSKIWVPEFNDREKWWRILWLTKSRNMHVWMAGLLACVVAALMLTQHPVSCLQILLWWWYVSLPCTMFGDCLKEQGQAWTLELDLSPVFLWTVDTYGHSLSVDTVTEPEPAAALDMESEQEQSLGFLKHEGPSTLFYFLFWKEAEFFMLLIFRKLTSVFWSHFRHKVM